MGTFVTYYCQSIWTQDCLTNFYVYLIISLVNGSLRNGLYRLISVTYRIFRSGIKHENKATLPMMNENSKVLNTSLLKYIMLNIMLHVSFDRNGTLYKSLIWDQMD